MQRGTFRQNAEKLPRHASDACTANPLAGTIFLPCAAHIPVPAPRGLPHPPAAPSLCTAVLVHLCGQPCGHSMTHRNLLPVRRGTPAVPAPLSRRSCTAVIPLQQPSVNTVETPENSAHMFTDHTDAACPESDCCESSLTVFSIVKNQKIVNTARGKSFNNVILDGRMSVVWGWKEF